MKIEKDERYWRVRGANGTLRAWMWHDGSVWLFDANGNLRAELSPGGDVSLFDEQMRLRAILEAE